MTIARRARQRRSTLAGHRAGVEQAVVVVRLLRPVRNEGVINLGAPRILAARSARRVKAELAKDAVVDATMRIRGVIGAEGGAAVLHLPTQALKPRAENLNQCATAGRTTNRIHDRDDEQRRIVVSPLTPLRRKVKVIERHLDGAHAGHI